MKGAVAAAVLATLLAAPAARAQESLTLEQALQLARKRNRTLTVERARLLQAQTNVEQGWAALFPTVVAQGKYSRNYKEVALAFGPGAPPLLIQPSNQLDAAISFTAPIVVPAAYPALAALKAGARASEASFAVAETNLLVSVANTFYLASIADEVVLARQSNIQVARATLQNARTRHEAGTVTKVDVDRAELALVRAEQLEREARNGQGRTYRALATLIQETRPFKVEVTPVPPEMHDERELDLALKLRPEFRLLEESTKAAESQADAHGWRWAPSISAFGNARRFNYDNFVRDRYSWVVGAQLDWVLFDGGTRDALRHYASAQAAESRARSEVLRDQIRDDLADGRRQLETKQKGLEAAERSVALARSTLELVRVQYEAGSVTQVDLLQAQDALVISQEALAQAHYDVAAADLLLRRAAGTFPPK
jgi:OMF family outer membrane factor